MVVVGGPLKLMGLYGAAGFAGGTSGGGSGNARPITISSMFKISESILVNWVISTVTQNSLLKEGKNNDKCT